MTKNIVRVKSGFSGIHPIYKFSREIEKIIIRKNPRIHPIYHFYDFSHNNDNLGLLFLKISRNSAYF